MPADTNARAIIHVDMDAFYAAVEELDDPSLRGRPVIVGGTGRRGVVSTANYVARQYGVHSAQPGVVARRRCPQGVFLRPRGARYREVSEQVFAVFRRFTPLVEGLSLDEAFLDVTGSLKLFGDIEAIGAALRDGIREDTGLDASVGMSHNKFLAKLASDADKPRGFVHVRPEQVASFLDPMPIGRLWGIGRQTEPKLRRLGILTFGQLRRADVAALRPALGQRAGHFQALARGDDDRPVNATREEKSISHEVTFDTDLNEDRELLAELQRQTEAVMRRVRRKGLSARTVQIKVRNARFETSTRSRSLRAATTSTATAWSMARALFQRWRSEHQATPIRLLGMGVSGLQPADEAMLGDSPQSRALDRTLDAIGDRWGAGTVQHGLAMRRRDADED